MKFDKLLVTVTRVNGRKVLEVPQILHSLHVIRSSCKDGNTINNLDILIEMIMK
jgi:hypothetical protein